MHILAILGAIITILILVRRLDDAGIDLGWLNPFLWRRRRNWRNRLEANPLFAIESPRDLAALMAVAVAKRDGDLSSDQKRLLLELFVSDFNVDQRTASGLVTSSVFMLGDLNAFLDATEKVMKPALPAFTDHQSQATIELINKAARLDSEPSALQLELIDRVSATLQQKNPRSEWVSHR